MADAEINKKDDEKVIYPASKKKIIQPINVDSVTADDSSSKTDADTPPSSRKKIVPISKTEEENEASDNPVESAIEITEEAPPAETPDSNKKEESESVPAPETSSETAKKNDEATSVPADEPVAQTPEATDKEPIEKTSEPAEKQIDELADEESTGEDDTKTPKTDEKFIDEGQYHIKLDKKAIAKVEKRTGGGKSLFLKVIILIGLCLAVAAAYGIYALGLLPL